jgi:Glycosyl transferase family 2
MSSALSTQEATSELDPRLSACQLRRLICAAMLAATLESLADQGMRKHRCEVVVKDDGSRDATPEVHP